LNKPDYRIASADRDGLGLALDWAAAEGWNPGPGDPDSFFASDPSGFLLGWHGDTAIASISASSWAEARQPCVAAGQSPEPVLHSAGPPRQACP
jgi:hypothetical protein